MLVEAEICEGSLTEVRLRGNSHWNRPLVGFDAVSVMIEYCADDAP